MRAESLTVRRETAGDAEVRQVDRLYWLDEDRPALGEALLPDDNIRW